MVLRKEMTCLKIKVSYPECLVPRYSDHYLESQPHFLPIVSCIWKPNILRNLSLQKDQRFEWLESNLLLD